MKVGLDVTILRRGAGAGTALYAYNLARALLRAAEVERLVVYMAARESAAGTTALEELAADGAEVVRGRPPGRWSPDAAWWLPIPRRLPRPLRDLDVFHAGEFFFPDPLGVPVVATVHDITEVLYPELHTWLNRRMHGRRLRWVRRHAARVITDAESTRADLLRHTAMDPERIVTVPAARAHGEAPPPEPAERRSILRELGLGEDPFVLCVATLEPRKNHVRLIRAFEALPERHRRVRLVLAGGRGWHAEPILETIAGSPASDRIRVTGHVPAAVLRTLYAEATVFAYPSLYEGFGLPVLEAMAAGAPVVTSDVSSIPEVAGDAALLVDPRDTDAIGRALTLLLDDPDLRSRLGEAGRRQEAGFTWERTARGTLEAYRAAMAEGRP